MVPSNNHLRDFLNYYIKLTSPGYAVLVTGAWGTGKTYQVRRIVPVNESLYVSLYGVSNVDQLHTEILAVAYPTFQKVDKVAALAKGMGQYAAAFGNATNLIGAYLRKELKADKTLILDDLERSKIPLQELLGVINSYVEHRGFRVIVIAHDRKITKNFRKIREKTFGQVISAHPQIGDAFAEFLKEVVSSQSKKFIESYKKSIISIFEKSGEKSLRILRYVIKDLERLYETLTPEHLRNDSAMERLILIFTAFDVGVRSGELSAGDLRNRRDVEVGYYVKSMGGSGNQKLPPIMRVSKKYPEINLTSDMMLSDEVLESIFINGKFDRDEIRRSLNNSAHFLQPSDVPAWKVVINFDELDDVVVNRAVNLMDQQFNQREVTNSGELLHIFSLRLMMAEERISNNTIEEEVAACKAYIDDLRELNKLPPRSTDWRWKNEFSRAHDGLGYWVTEKTRAHFKVLWNYLISAREEVLKGKFGELVDDLIDKIKGDPKAAVDMLGKGGGENSYASIPFLSNANPDRLVDAWFSLPKEQWRMIQSAFSDRYGQGQLQQELEDEIGWARTLYQELQRRASEASGLAELRIRRIIPIELRNLENIK